MLTPHRTIHHSSLNTSQKPLVKNYQEIPKVLNNQKEVLWSRSNDSLHIIRFTAD